MSVVSGPLCVVGFRRDNGPRTTGNGPPQKSQPPRCSARKARRLGISDFSPIATGCVAARRAKVWRASALAVRVTLAHANCLAPPSECEARKPISRNLPDSSAVSGTDCSRNLRSRRPKTPAERPVWQPCRHTSPIQFTPRRQRNPANCCQNAKSSRLPGRSDATALGRSTRPRANPVSTTDWHAACTRDRSRPRRSCISGTHVWPLRACRRPLCASPPILHRRDACLATTPAAAPAPLA